MSPLTTQYMVNKLKLLKVMTTLWQLEEFINPPISRFRNSESGNADDATRSAFTILEVKV